MFKYGTLQSQNLIIPEAFLRIANPTKPDNIIIVKAIVDTGAMKTCIPESDIKQLGNMEYKENNTRGFDGIQKKLKLYRIKVKLTNQRTDTQEFMCTYIFEHDCNELEVLSLPNKKYAIIGRDILNQFQVVLNAPQQKWKFHTAECS